MTDCLMHIIGEEQKQTFFTSTAGVHSLMEMASQQEWAAQPQKDSLTAREGISVPL